MLFERIASIGLAQYSYIVGDGTEAIVIDPRRDCEIYIRKALDAGMQITHILETHRHEDFAVGSVELARRTDAQIWHADAQLPYKYGKAATEGQSWRLGNFKLSAIHTPGHTEGSMSYVLYAAQDVPWMVFTGDVLFTGEVGRVDFLGMDRALEMAGHLYDAIFRKILLLGDGVLLCPAHGAGSACGGVIADRPWSTLGLERELNPRLQFSTRESFMTDVTRQLPKPPYFERMEVWNLEGPPHLGALPVPKALSAIGFMSFVEAARETVIIDTRDMVGFSGGHIPGALDIPMQLLPLYTGWFVPYDVPILLVTGTCDPMDAVRHLIRIGYDDVAGYLVGGMRAWAASRMPVETAPFIAPQTLADHQGSLWVLDVREEEELQGGTVPGAHNIPLKQLPQRLGEVPDGASVVTYCRGGPRSMLAASVLRREGYKMTSVLLGGLNAWREDGLPLE